MDRFQKLTTLGHAAKTTCAKLRGVAARLRRDRSGNTLIMVAAAIAPLMALLGGSIDMGRSYLSETRLQQACDAGVLAARKKLGATAPSGGSVPTEVEEVGNRFFNINFRSGDYGTDNRNFVMTLNPDYTISGVATVEVPTTIMRIFGHDDVPVQVTCEAQFAINTAKNTDFMLVLDTTASMQQQNPDDTEPRINIMKNVLKDFYGDVSAANAASGGISRLRFGFLPYSTNVNVGTLLKSDWMVTNWHYQSRIPRDLGTFTHNVYYNVTYTMISGTETAITPYMAAECPLYTYNVTYGPTTTISTTPHVFEYTTTQHGSNHWCVATDGQFTVYGWVYDNRVMTTRYTFAYERDDPNYTYDYQDVTNIDVSTVQNPSGNGDDPAVTSTAPFNVYPPNSDGTPNTYNAWFSGCIEERDTAQISDYTDSTAVLATALDLDIDLVPNPAAPATQWRPQFPDIVYARSLFTASSMTYSIAPSTFSGTYVVPAWNSASFCPYAARNLDDSWDVTSFNSYVDAITTGGDTYHDIGMIWGGRLLSPTGIFAAENADVDGKPTDRNLIFLTDGITEANVLSYGAYGVEPIDPRRWTFTSGSTFEQANDSLSEVIEDRFAFSCEEVKKKNITIWVIGFGVEMTDLLKTCATDDNHWFQADSAEQLTAAFNSITNSTADLRVTK